MEAVTTFLQPSKIEGLQDFLGMVNFYNRFIPLVGQLMCPLDEALSGRKASAVLDWTEERLQDFASTKVALVIVALLAHLSIIQSVLFT